MNYMGKIAEMLGVKLEEWFDVKSGETIIPNCYIDTLGLHNSNLEIMPKLLLKLLNGDAEIIRPPFRPKIEGHYFHVTSDGRICDITNSGGTYDRMAMLTGNCFCSEAEAESHK
ncbi:MAG: hypothetical protein ACI4EA_06255, partial [Candidatus Ornithomonoglobus sp.]